MRRLAAAVLAWTAGLAAASDYVVDGALIVKSVNWNKFETVTVRLGEHYFEPADLHLKAGKAYKIELRNVGQRDHHYTAPEFFRAVAWRKLSVSKQAEIRVDYVNSVEVEREGQLDLYIVPVTVGTYEVTCTLDDHREKGMVGSVTIE